MTTRTHNFTTAQWQALDQRHHVHPFTDIKALGERGARVITRADGVYLWDSDGNQILDGMAGLWCVNVGYGRAELAEAAKQQMLELPYYNTFFQTTHPPVAALAELLDEVTPANVHHAFFTNSGSEANDTVVRMVRRYWDLMGQPRRDVIVSRLNAYHGSTVAGASLGGMAAMHEQGGLPIPGIVHIRQPYWYAEGKGQSPEEFGLECARALEEKILELGADRVGAFIGEPIQGAGGVIVPPDSYWPEIQRICRKYDILLVVDEVICGFGRTGKWFGSDLYGLEPDLMPIAKGLSSGYLPIGAVMMGERVFDVMRERGGEFAHGYTYSGHPAACAVAIRNIEILRDEGIVDRVGADTGPYFQQRLAELGEHPLVGEVRGVGMVAAIELAADPHTRRPFSPVGRVGGLCRDHSFASGLVMRAVRDTMILSPPLVITREQIDELVDKARRALDLTLGDGGP